MRMEIFLEKKPLKQFKLYELTENELNINLDQVTQWQLIGENVCLQIIKRFIKNISQNGFADFICNKEYMIEIFSRGLQKDFQFKNTISYGNPLVLMSEHWFPLDNKQELVQAKMEMIQKEKDEELEEKKAQQAFMIKKKNKVKGKGKIQKKDDKKNVKKGEDEPVQKIIYICK
ncbi:unnamed protein product [Paramecium primaurelia]|uniref:Uncharacterized protein n=1 Tax=Paramecium primaurelia TaxID=5886 RepID=A0A8S1LJH7_PARPR|nr:unnamed protein product [Paramecium primaurelia]